MAGRARRRSADLAETRLGITAAIPKRDIQRGGVLVSRPVGQRRTAGQILKAIFEEHRMAGKLNHSVGLGAGVLIVAAATGGRRSRSAPRPRSIPVPRARRPAARPPRSPSARACCTRNASTPRRPAPCSFCFSIKSTLNIAPNTSSGDRRIRLRSGIRQRPHADQADARHAAIYRRQAQPSGRGHDPDARGRHRHPRRHRDRQPQRQQRNANRQSVRSHHDHEWRRHDRHHPARLCGDNH